MSFSGQARMQLPQRAQSALMRAGSALGGRIALCPLGPSVCLTTRLAAAAGMAARRVRRVVATW